MAEELPKDWWTLRPSTTLTAVAYTALSTDSRIGCTTSGSPYSISLPPSSAVPDKVYWIGKLSGSDVVTLDAYGAETFQYDSLGIVDGDATLKINRAGSWWKIAAAPDGTGWWVVDVVGRNDASFQLHNSNVTAGRTSLPGLFSTKLGCGATTGANIGVIADAHALGVAVDLSHGHASDPGDWTYTLDVVNATQSIQRSATATIVLDELGILDHNPNPVWFSSPMAIAAATEVFQSRFTGPSTDAVLFAVRHMVVLDP